MKTSQNSSTNNQTKQTQLTQNNCVTIIAGPCSVESSQQIEEISSILQKHNLSWIRGGAFKPRSNIHSFQGLGTKGLEILSEISHQHNLKCISEITSQHNIKDTIKYCDAVQIGTRNMTNYQLLSDIGLVTQENQVPVLFKRGMASTINEWLCASEYISQHNTNIVLCERGLRTFEDSTRFTLDISAVPVIHRQSNYPVCVDVSHAAGKAQYVPDLACGALAAGADAIMIEVHPDPKHALSDSSQQLSINQFEKLLNQLSSLATAMGKKLV